MCNLSQGIEDRGIALGKAQGLAIGKEQGLAIGKEQGITLGKEEQARESAIQMYQDQIPVEKIARYTGCAIEKIQGWIAG